MVCTLFKFPFNFRLRVLNRAKVRPAEPFERVESRSDLTNTVKTRKKIKIKNKK